MKTLCKERLSVYDAQIEKKRLTFIVVFIIMLAVALYATASGSITLSISEIMRTIFGNGEAASNTVVFGIRLPRVATAILVGALLAVSGAVMQCVLHNPLASASTLGVSQGASFGAAIGIIIFGGGVVNGGSSNVAIEVNNPYIVTLSAFVFGSLSTAVILLLSQLKKNLGPGGLVLAGVALSSLFTGGSTLLQYFADETKLTAVVFWTFGNLGGTNWAEILVLAVIFLAAMTYFMLNRWNYNAMRCGADTAKSLGVNARAVMLVSMVICSFAAAVAVAFVGIISFVGLVAPHMMRKFVGDDYRFIIPCSAVAGALVLLAADTFGRLIISPVILPVGAITAFLGAPAFLTLLLRGGDRD
ncbi:iron complex transport system permease protein [Ruminiclostridium sufflavum DSM 19573]|uniref:Iron complex transport system permease protein n=1 Tax=Ruminiclostridium sufflavum DSM 19573 TaxID=1121337 RepID=A0A318XJL0_9FIRM|nr:iron ABC transporter permease [Ruminiclostridium sufflavum]PYG84342.1 iron complex transport system permease protein [Ruminiclostridium sufflavum DSM 19573]